MDGSVIVSHRTLHRVSLAVLLIDELTGSAITGSNARAWIENERPPIKKGDGWFIFTDLSPRRYTVLAEGGHYQRLSADCVLDAKERQTLRLCLRPSRTYPVPYGCLSVNGKAEPGAEVTAYVLNRQSAYKLLADAAKGGDTLTVFHTEGADLEGGTFRLISSDGKEENVTVRSKIGENAYRLLSPLGGDYPRIGSLMVPAVTATADRSGRFFMALKGSSSAKIVCEAKGSRTVRREYEHERGDSDIICPVLDE